MDVKVAQLCFWRIIGWGGTCFSLN